MSQCLSTDLNTIWMLVIEIRIIRLINSIEWSITIRHTKSINRIENAGETVWKCSHFVSKIHKKIIIGSYADAHINVVSVVS